MWGIFKKKEIPVDYGPVPEDFSFLGVDFHSHLIPGIDDGSPDVSLSVAHLRAMQQLGFRKIITTPHVHGDFYRNTREQIVEGRQQVQKILDAEGVDIQLEAAAEYYLDNYFLQEVLPKGLLTFEGNKVLVEVSMAGWPRNFDEMLFAIQGAGYEPVLAHPERYPYIEDVHFFGRLKERGVALQMNLLAPTGYYGAHIREAALKLLDAKLYDYAASDLHHERHEENLHRMLENHKPLMARLAGYGFKNNSLGVS